MGKTSVAAETVLNGLVFVVYGSLHFFVLSSTDLDHTVPVHQPPGESSRTWHGEQSSAMAYLVGDTLVTSFLLTEYQTTLFCQKQENYILFTYTTQKNAGIGANQPYSITSTTKRREWGRKSMARGLNAT